jgi:hypothetical protein
MQDMSLQKVVLLEISLFSFLQEADNYIEALGERLN